MARRIPFRVIVPMLLMATVGVLAALQYRWLGQVSAAERARMHETMTARAEAFANDLDHEIARVYVAFQVQQPEMSALAATLGRRYQLWRESTPYPDLVSGIYVAQSGDTLEQYDVDEGTLQRIAWPERLLPLRIEEAQPVPVDEGRSAIAFRFARAISARPLAVSTILPIPPHEGSPPRPMGFPGLVLVTLDESVLTGSILPALAREHLGDSLDEYRMVVVEAEEPAGVVYGSLEDARAVDAGHADIKVGTLTLRPQIAERVLASELRATTMFVAGLEASQRATDGAWIPRRDHMTVLIRQQPGVAGAEPPTSRMTSLTRAVAAGAAWQVLLKHRAGSLEAAVQHVRRRNLMVSFGMLSLLAISVGLVLVSARRAERLASQQMDFVATVSHELRTPLAVIRSAGQNLSAGVVQDPRRYGELIETEGRRLTEMIEQTLALAGLSGDRRPLAQHPIDAGDLVRDVAASPETSSQSMGASIEIRIADELPPVLADEMLLRRGVQNLLANALKYGRDGRWVGIAVDAHRGRRGREVRITVSDRGPGIAAEDLPHIFEPFFRGRSAVADQVPGNGLGLHLVRRIAEAHGGRVSVRSATGEGTSFSIHLPAAGDPARHATTGEQPQPALEQS